MRASRPRRWRRIPTASASCWQPRGGPGLVQPRSCALAFRLPRPIPQPLPLAALAGAETLDLDLGDPLGIGSEYLPLLQAGRIKATERLRGEETGYVVLPVSSRHGLCLLGVARA